MPPNAVPTSMPASARMKRAVPSSATMAMRSADHENISPVAKLGTSAAATQVGGKLAVGRGAERAARRFGHHRLLVQEAPQLAIGLQDRRAAAREQARLDLADQPDQRRRDGQHQQHLAALPEQAVAEATLRRRRPSPPQHHHAPQSDQRREHQGEIALDGEKLQHIEPPTHLHLHPPPARRGGPHRIDDRKPGPRPARCRRAAASPTLLAHPQRDRHGTPGGSAGRSWRRCSAASPARRREAAVPRRRPAGGAGMAISGGCRRTPGTTTPPGRRRS